MAAEPSERRRSSSTGPVETGASVGTPGGAGSVQTTRDRVLAAAMDLFGRQGYGPTTVAQIERAAGLSVGAGGLYRHFRSKKAILVEGLRRHAEAGQGLLAVLDGTASADELPPRERLLALGRAGLARLEQERDLNRLLVRDLAQFPELLEQVREAEVRAVFDGLRHWLAH